MNFKKIRKFRRDMKAISPIIATLLLIAIAVVAALVTYAWVMGYIGFQTNNSGASVVIQSVTFAGASPTEAVQTVYLQNLGTSPVTLNSFVYINGQQEPTTSIMVAGAAATVLPAGSTATITCATTGTGVVTFASTNSVTIKVTTTGGTYSQITQQAP
jgi:flagellin-like protein